MNTNRWIGNRGVWTPNRKFYGLTAEQIDAYTAAKEEARKAAAIRDYQNRRKVIELNSIEPEECNDNGCNVCTCRRCNPPMPSVDDGELPY